MNNDFFIDFCLENYIVAPVLYNIGLLMEIHSIDGDNAVPHAGG
jgi:hypothetical protein